MIEPKVCLFVFWCVLAGFYLFLALVTGSYYKKIKNVEVTFSLTERGESVFGKQELGSVGIADSFKELSKIDLIGFFLASMAALITGITLFINHQ